jgi:hypothetical protein
MIISKLEAKERKIEHQIICKFHMIHPDQRGTYECKDCFIIEDKCGCDMDMECENCDGGGKKMEGL